MRAEAGGGSYYVFVRPDLRVGVYLEASRSKMLEWSWRDHTAV